MAKTEKNVNNYCDSFLTNYLHWCRAFVVIIKFCDGQRTHVTFATSDKENGEKLKKKKKTMCICSVLCVCTHCVRVLVSCLYIETIKFALIHCIMQWWHKLSSSTTFPQSRVINWWNIAWHCGETTRNRLFATIHAERQKKNRENDCILSEYQFLDQKQ